MSAGLLQRWRTARGGAAAVEFALVVPVLIALAAGAVELGRAFQVHNAVNRLATQSAIAYSDCSDVPAGACGIEIALYGAPAAIRNIVPELDPARLTLSVFQVRMAGPDPVVTYAFPFGATLSRAQQVAAQEAFSGRQSGVIVTAAYGHALAFFPGTAALWLSRHLSPVYTVTQLKS